MKINHCLNSADDRSDSERAASDPSEALVATAYHEAGHAVVAVSLGRLIDKVSIRPGNSPQGKSRLGVCQLRKGRSKATRNEFEDDILILFAGMVAESNFTGQYCKQGAGQDLQMVKRILQQRVRNQKQFDRIFQRLLDKAEHVLDDEAHSQAVELVAKDLIERETISGRAVRHFFDQAVKKFE